MQDLLRAAAEALENLADKAHQWADWAGGDVADESPPQFAGIDIVGIDFSTSIQQVAGPVIRGWDNYRRQVQALRPDCGVRAFGINAVPFPLNRRPVPPQQLPSFHSGHFQSRGFGQGLVEVGSAFYDYFFVAIGQAQQLGVFDVNSALPVSISLLSDGLPNGGNYGPADVRPLIEAARARGVRIRLVVIGQPKYWEYIWQFSEQLGIARNEMEVIWDYGSVPAPQSFADGFGLLSWPLTERHQ